MIGPRSTALACVLAAACAGAPAADARWTWKAAALAGAPLASGEGRSARATVEPGLKWSDGALELRGGLRLRWIEQQRDERSDADLRELSASWRRGETTFTVGAQQLNWGRMDILRVTDIVNPVDHHDLFHEELPEAKLALWMANWEWQRGAHSLQLVATPQPSVDRLPARSGPLPVRVDKPAASLGHSTLAARYGFEAADWNIDLQAIRGWQSMPSLRLVTGADGPGLRGAPARQHSVGFSADRPLGGTVLRLEGLWARVRPDAEPGASRAALRSATLGAGVDLKAGSWFFAGQVITARSLDRPPGADLPRDQAFVSAIVEWKGLQDRLSARGTAIRETAAGSSWSSLQLSYELTPNQLLRLQTDWFAGAASTPFGSFRGRSRMAASMRFQM